MGFWLLRYDISTTPSFFREIDLQQLASPWSYESRMDHTMYLGNRTAPDPTLMPVY